MRDSVRRCKEAFLRTQAFALEHFEGVSPTSFAGRHLGTIDSVTAGLDSHTGAQAASRSAWRQGTLAKDAALAKVLRTFEVLSRTARPMEASDPTLLQQFRVPHGESVQGVLAAAAAAATAARQLKTEFLVRGLAENFIEAFEADIEALRGAVARNIENRRAHVTATAFINDLCGRGMKALRELDPYMRNFFVDEPSKLAAWLSASRVERRTPRPRRNGQQPAPPNSPTTNTPAPPPGS